VVALWQVYRRNIGSGYHGVSRRVFSIFFSLAN